MPPYLIDWLNKVESYYQNSVKTIKRWFADTIAPRRPQHVLHQAGEILRQKKTG